MASSNEGGPEMAALRQRIEHGLMLLGKEANTSTRERMEAAIQADRDRLRQLESDQTPARKPQQIVPERLKSKIWEVIEEASRYQEDEHQQDETTSNSNNSFFPHHHLHHHPRKPTPRVERDTTTIRPNNPISPRAPSATRDEDEERRAQIIAELQRRREVLLSQLKPDSPAQKSPTAEERQRAEEAERRKRELARLDLKTAIPRERSAGGGVTYALVSPTVGSFGPDVHETLQRTWSTGATGTTRTASVTTPTKIMKEPQRTAVPTFRVSSSATPGSERKRSSTRRPKENRDSSTSGETESRPSQRSQQQSHHRHHDLRSPRSETTPYPPRSRADRPPVSSPVYSENEQQLPRLRRRDSERSSGTASSSNRPSNDPMIHTTSTASPSRRRERDQERGDTKKSSNNSSISGEAPRRSRHRSLSRDGTRRSKVPPPAPTPPVPGSLLEELLKRGPWRAS